MFDAPAPPAAHIIAQPGPNPYGGADGGLPPLAGEVEACFLGQSTRGGGRRAERRPSIQKPTPRSSIASCSHIAWHPIRKTTRAKASPGAHLCRLRWADLRFRAVGGVGSVERARASPKHPSAQRSRERHEGNSRAASSYPRTMYRYRTLQLSRRLEYGRSWRLQRRAWRRVQ